MNTYFIDKTQNTMADSLKAAGFIQILAELFGQLEIKSDITLIAQGAYYQIETIQPLDLEQVAQVDFFMPARFLKTNKNQKNLPDSAELYWDDYEKERDKRSEFFDIHFKNLEGTAKRAYGRGEEHPALKAIIHSYPHPHWDLFRALNPANIIGYNNLLVQWHEIGEAGLTGEVCLLLLEMFKQLGNDVASAETNWKKIAKPYKWKNSVTASQLYNPSQGKGINKVLPNNVGLANVKNFWLIELLKAIGFMEIAFPRGLRGSKDRKTYVPAFGRMKRKTRNEIDELFRAKMRFSQTAVLSDILTVINYLQTFIDYVQTPSDEDNDPFAFDDEQPIQPARFMHGFHAVFYKDLGNSAATMNIAFLNLPDWVIIESNDDGVLFKSILEEHKQVVEQFDEGISDELTLLQTYRDFIVADHLDSFFDFTTLFSSYLISKGEKKGGFASKRFTTDNLRSLIMRNDKSLSPILESQGFRNIATAIRRSTISAQFRKNKFDDRRYDVRYGLGRDLMRQAQYRHDFMNALNEFMQSYNQENAQVMDTRPGPYRPSITTTDIEEIAQLMDEYSAELIAKMLVAFGYAREPYQEKEEEKNETNPS